MQENQSENKNLVVSKKSLNNKKNIISHKSHMTASEKYDMEHNFIPIACSSKAMDNCTQSSGSDFLLSQILNDSQERRYLPDVDDSNGNITLAGWGLSQNLSLLSNTFVEEDMKKKVLMPKYYPPTAQEVSASLTEYNIPEHRFQTPFYSNISDITRKVDIGHSVLKIPSNTTADLEEFKSSIVFCSLNIWRKNKFIKLHPNLNAKQNLRILLADNSLCIISPAILPPSKKSIFQWIKEQNNSLKLQTPIKHEKSRIIIPLSPGDGNESDECMTLSPCTPTPIFTPKHSPDLNIIQTTPSSSQSTNKIKRKSPRGLHRKLFSQDKVKLDIVQNYSNLNNSFGISGVTPNNTHEFQMSLENLQNAKAIEECQFLTTMVVEVHIRTRGTLNPDPSMDPIRAIFYSILNDVPENSIISNKIEGIIALNSVDNNSPKDILDGLGLTCEIVYVPTEQELLECFVNLVRRHDPEICLGYETEMQSWGYLIERSNTFGMNMTHLVSRLNVRVKQRSLDETQETKITGRILIDFWRLLRHEIALQSYTFENIMYHVLHRRVPKRTYKDLSFWWEHRTNLWRHITVQYYQTKIRGIYEILEQLDLIGRTSELARLFGIQFFEVLSRGSQFRVESMMLRLAKPLNYIPVSPSVQQRAKMRAPEWLPLILEPESRFYVDPIIVLDFQSLYPSIIIAYNYCFSTCIGRVECLGGEIPFEFGATQLKFPKKLMKKYQNKINFSPCGVGFVNAEVRRGILPKMLQEILETRLMVKNSMKANKDNKILQRVLHSRQLGLKLIANVTYGYTAANFSGRMPCIEVGDSVVSKGRETLERAIKLIENSSKWKAKVVYGDTDSLFILVPGRSKEDAFKIGSEIADAVTADNPSPVKLKLEKIYQPCILQTKKRYVGYMFECPSQKIPEFSAKGIETVRRDGCPAVSKILEKCLKILFDSKDVSLVKRYVTRQFDKILTGRANIQDLIFAKEYRGRSGYRPGACVPALELAKKWAQTDKRKEPRRGERVPYIIVNGPPGLPLIKHVRSPYELLADQSLKPNSIYYITRVIIPPINRCFSLIGVDVNTWFNEMPRKQYQIFGKNLESAGKKSTISQYFAKANCITCGNQTKEGLCETCQSKPHMVHIVLQNKINKYERTFDEIKQICKSCCGGEEHIDCISLDCPVLYRLNQIEFDLKQVPFIRDLLSQCS